MRSFNTFYYQASKWLSSAHPVQGTSFFVFLPLLYLEQKQVFSYTVSALSLDQNTSADRKRFLALNRYVMLHHVVASIFNSKHIHCYNLGTEKEKNKDLKCQHISSAKKKQSLLGLVQETGSSLQNLLNNVSALYTLYTWFLFFLISTRAAGGHLQEMHIFDWFHLSEDSVV